MAAVDIVVLMQRVRKWLQDEPYEDAHTDALTSSASDNIMTVADGTKYKEGNTIEWKNPDALGNFERAKVVSKSGDEITLFRGHDDTVVYAHSANSRFYKDPSWTGDQILRAINDAVASELWPWAWNKGSVNVTPAVGTVWYDIAADFIDPIQIVQLYSNNLRPGAYGTRNGIAVQIARNLPTALVPSGNGISFPEGKYHATNVIKVDYRRLVTTATVEEGMMADVVVFAVCEALMAARDLKKAEKDNRQTMAGVRTAEAFRIKKERKREQLLSYLMITIPPAKVWRQ
jgi:hypothetical protein